MANFNELVASGNRADQPAANTTGVGALYCVEDENFIVERSNGSSWEQFSPTSVAAAAHATTHQSGGSDQIKLDDLATPDDNTDLNASSTRHGLLKKLSNTATEFLDGQGNFDTVKDSDLSTSDVTDNNASTSKHGFLKKLSNVATEYMDGTGNWSEPAGGGSGNGDPFALTTYPDYSTFTAVNDSACTHGEASNGLLYIRNGKAAGGNLAMLVKASPGAANTVTAAIITGMYVGATSEHLTGLVLYDTGSTKAIVFGVDQQSGGAEPRTFLNVQYWNAPGTYSSEPVKLAIYAWPTPLLWLRIDDDGSTNRKYQISFNGVHFEDAYSTTRTTHFTSPDRVGVGCVRWSGTTYPAILSCASFTAV